MYTKIVVPMNDGKLLARMRLCFSVSECCLTIGNFVTGICPVIVFSEQEGYRYKVLILICWKIAGELKLLRT